MGKFRTKLKGQRKGKRWPKGQSSNSNPETRKYRNQAKSRFFKEVIGPSNLTSDALKKHDAIQSFSPKSTQPSIQESEDATETSMYSSYSSMKTFATDWTDCSNMSYARFLNVFRSDSALHKEMLAVLAAITEVIKENGGSETSTEYYCALLTTLEQVMTLEERKEEQITAVLSLINMGIKSVPEAVLRSTFEQVSTKILSILNEYSSSENNAVIKAIFGILSVILRVQDLSIWSTSNMTQIFQAILNPFCIHSKPKWRKAAQQAASAIVRASSFVDKTSKNPPADIVADFCKNSLNNCLGNNSNNVLLSNLQTGQTTMLHVLGLMKDTICKFSKQNIKLCSEIALRLIKLNYPLVTSCSFQVFFSLFSDQKAIVPAKLNAQIISALYDCQPGVNDVQPSQAWLLVMQQAHIHLSDVDLNLSCSALPRIFATVTNMWLCENMDVISASTRCIESLLRDAVSPAVVTPELVSRYRSKLVEIINSIELGLGYQYHTAWHHVLHIMKVLFEVCGTNCEDLLTSCLKSLSELRDSYKFTYNSALEHAVGAAIRSLGPEAVLKVITLQRNNGDLNLDRSWLLPVLKENIKRASLDFFIKDILRLAVYCQKHSMELSKNNDGIGSHSYELLYLQLWNLLPSFCNDPTDIKDSFKNIAKVLGTAISDRKELRLAVMASLRKLIIVAKKNENEEDIAEISRFDKNYLPILFNVYTTKSIGTDEEGQRLAALDTIKVYLTIAKSELTQSLFNSALERLKNTEDLFLKESILDLIRVLIPYQKVEEISTLYDVCIKTLPEIKNNKEQKKAYRMLEEICKCDSENCKTFVKNNRKSVQKLLMKSLNTAAVSSKGARMRCLNYLVRAQPHLDHTSNFLKSVVPEAILCVKDINEKCRNAAFILLISVGETLEAHNQIQEFLNLMVVGLVGTPQLISCTVLALATILHHFSGILGNENIHKLLESVMNLLMSPTREIVASCLSYIKVHIKCLPSPMVASTLPIIMKGLTAMTEDCKRHFRLKVRDILDRLMRKYGCESLTPHIPSSDVVMYKRLRNLRKLNARKKRKKENDEESEKDEDEEFIVNSKPKSIEAILEDTDSELEEMEIDEPKNNKNKKMVQTWIEEDGDDIVDFTDNTARSKITATKPGQAPTAVLEKKKEKDRGFKTAPDGRLIIQDDSDSESDNEKELKFSENSDSEDISDAETRVLTDRKRKRSDASSTKSGFSSKSGSQIKYKPGGKGIHRSLASSSSQRGDGSEYKSKKSKGDVKKKGKMDPYAYLPLQRSALNKRKKAKLAGRFKNIIKAAKSGAKKGSKLKKHK